MVGFYKLTPKAKILPVENFWNRPKQHSCERVAPDHRDAAKSPAMVSRRVLHARKSLLDITGPDSDTAQIAL
jgi:hypothetical protein